MVLYCYRLFHLFCLTTEPHLKALQSLEVLEVLEVLEAPRQTHQPLY